MMLGKKNNLLAFMFLEPSMAYANVLAPRRGESQGLGSCLRLPIPPLAALRWGLRHMFFGKMKMTLL